MAAAPPPSCQWAKTFGITCYDAGQLVIISKDGKTLKSYSKDDAGGALIGPNDGTPDGKGGAYFTLSGPWESVRLLAALFI